MKKFMLTVLISFFVYSFSYAQIQSSNSGLEINDHQNVRVLVEDLHEDANDISLTKESIESRVNVRLRQLNLTPLSRNDAFLYININVVGGAYNINVSFNRRTFFYEDDIEMDGVIYSTMADTWSLNSSGTHGRSSDFIINRLDSVLDRFFSDYLDAND